MKQVPAFQTSDGRLFDNERDAKLHEVSLQQADKIAQFIADEDFPYKAMAQRVIARNTIVRWEEWRSR